MKKVLFVATITSHIIGFHTPYLKWFKEQGYEVHVASNGDEYIEYCDKHFNLPFERFPFKKNNLTTYKKLKKIIYENNYEIIHCHTPVGGVLARLAARKSRKKGTRVIYTAHGFHFYKEAPLLNWIIYYPIEKIMAKYTDCLITINTEDYEIAKRKLKKIKEIEMIHGIGFNNQRFNIIISDDEKNALRKSMGFCESDKIITYVAELNDNKNQIFLIKTLEELIKVNENYKLLLIGGGINKEKYLNEVHKRNLDKFVRLLGIQKNLAKFLSITDIYVASSIREGLGLNIIEAIYMKLPILATNNRGHRELVNQKYIVDFKVEELKNRILELEKDKDKYEYKIDTKLYEVNNVLEEMKAIYERGN